ncbi:MAG: hypothetical protein PHU25_06980 [Deltaproteobacteria bacterium]|nr:hypothetical protein [Deltaproteobacteria bacterium]
MQDSKRQGQADGRSSRRRLMTAMLGCLGVAGCVSAPGIDLVPVFPADEPDLLKSAGVARLDVRAEPIGQGPAVAPVVEIVEEGRSLSIDGLAAGLWAISIQGLDADGREVVYGRTRPFAVKPGARGQVSFLIGRSFAFNKVALAPADAGKSVADLVDLTATPFTDTDGVQRILVAGGRRSRDGGPVGQAFLVDPSSFTVESLPVLSCPRAGHAAFAVETDEGTRVVLAGGQSNCEPGLEVFDPVRRAFSSVPVACPGVSSSRTAIPEIVRLGADSRQTGRVIVFGRTRCAVDILTGKSTTLGEADGTAPDNPQLAAGNSSGQVLVVDGRSIFVDAADEGESCIPGGEWLSEAEWSGLDDLNGRRIAALGNDRFLLAGGTPVEGVTQNYAWSLVSVRDCAIDYVLEGPPASQVPVSGFVPIHADQGTTTVVLFAGGLRKGSATDAVSAFYQPVDALAPTWHDLSSAGRERPVRLREPRAGHAAAALDDGTTWIIGGGGTSAEVFVAGTRGLDTASHRPMKLRSPMLTSMTVVDTTSFAEQPMNTMLAKTYPAGLYAEADDFVTVFFIAGNADRGIGDDLFGDTLYDRQGCKTIDTSSPTQLGGVISGSVLNTSFDDSWAVFGSQGGSTTYSKNAQAKAETLLDGYAAGKNACSWRQLLRVGLDGLEIGPPVDPGQPKVDTWNGVNVLLIAGRADDCSQGLYDDPRTDLLPDASVLSGRPCTDKKFDPYFGAPPLTDEDRAAFEAKLDGIVWDRADLIVATLGNPGTESCTSGAFGDMGAERRLGATADWIGGRGSSASKIDLCEAADEKPLATGIAGLVDRIVERNPLQACVPAGIVAAPALVGYRDDTRLYLPIDRQGAAAQAAAKAVSSACQVMYVESDDLTNGIHSTARPVAESAAGFTLATDTDGRGGCDDGWLVRFNRVENARKQGLEFKGAALMCVR